MRALLIHFHVYFYVQLHALGEARGVVNGLGVAEGLERVVLPRPETAVLGL